MPRTRANHRPAPSGLKRERQATLPHAKYHKTRPGHRSNTHCHHPGHDTAIGIQMPRQPEADTTQQRSATHWPRPGHRSNTQSRPRAHTIKASRTQTVAQTGALRRNERVRSTRSRRRRRRRVRLTRGVKSGGLSSTKTNIRPLGEASRAEVVRS